MLLSGRRSLLFSQSTNSLILPEALLNQLNIILKNFQLNSQQLLCLIVTDIHA